MRLGLETAGFSKWETYLEQRNIDRFRSWYGCRPAVCEAVWIKLQEQMSMMKKKRSVVETVSIVLIPCTFCLDSAFCGHIALKWSSLGFSK
jgi:hypothetical protein